MTQAADWTFDSVIELMPWGRNVYTIVRLDSGLERAAKAAQTRRVHGWLDEIPVNVGINRADVINDPFMYVGKALLRQLDAAPGDAVTCRLTPADPDAVLIAEDVGHALANTHRAKAFLRLPPAERRRLLAGIDNAATDRTRTNRIQKLVDLLSEGSNDSGGQAT